MSKRLQAEAERDERARRAALGQVRQFPDPILRLRAHPVEVFDDDLAALGDRMVDLMHDAHGAGLAAPQIGLLRRLFVFQVSDEEGAVVFVNPEIVDTGSEQASGGEGCLSLALLIDEGHDVPVDRHLVITVRAYDVAGEEIVRHAEGHEARVIQHELDHLDGVLIIDRTTREARNDALRLMRRALT